MKTEHAHVGARGIDTVILVSPQQALDLKAQGIDYVLQYLGSVTPAGVKGILDAGLAFMPVTYANKFNGASTVAQLKTLNLPKGCTVWLDVEGVENVPIADLKKSINNWATEVVAAEFMPGLYVGAGCPLTSVELYQLKVVRYWHSLSKVIDRNGQLAEPSCGWAQYQVYPSVYWENTGVWVDVNFIQKDYRERLPTWVKS